MLKVLDRVELEEVLVLCPLWDFAGLCGMKARTHGGPYQDHGNNQFGSPKES